MQVVERAVARVARRQDNVATLRQLSEAGLGRGAIEHRMQAGMMQRLYQGVYLLGPAPPTQMGRARAAVLACGEGAVLSHRSAAERYGLLPHAGGEAVDVTVVGRNPGVEPGIRLHRPRALARHDVVTMRGMRITSVARTIADLAGTESRHDTERAFQEALYRRLVAPAAIQAVLEREPRRRGAAVLKALLSDPRMTRSERERALLKLIAQAELPKPLTNVRLHGYLVDAYWPEQRLVLEFDGWQAHGHRLAFDGDRKRDQVMLAHALRVLRATDRHLAHESVALVVRIGQSLAA